MTTAPRNPETTVRELEAVRLAISLAHAVPGCVVRLTDWSGVARRVGFSTRFGVSITPCRVRVAIALAVAGEPGGLGPLLGLAEGPIRAIVVEASVGRSVGMGVFTEADAPDRYAFATTLDLHAVERAVEGAITDLRDDGGGPAWALEHAVVAVAHDPTVLTSVVSLKTAGNVAPDDADEAVLRIATSCAVHELIDLGTQL